MVQKVNEKFQLEWYLRGRFSHFLTMKKKTRDTGLQGC